MIISAFGFLDVDDDPSCGVSSTRPYYTSSDKGFTWDNNFILCHGDTTVEWSRSGTAFVTRLYDASNIDVYRSTDPTIGNGFFGLVPGSLYSVTSDNLDQPWLEVANVGGKDRIYVGFIDFSQPKGQEASIHFSKDGGTTWNNTPGAPNADPVVIERLTAGDNDFSVRVAHAKDSERVYAVFQRWNSDGPGGDDKQGDIVVVRSDDGGLDGFRALDDPVTIAVGDGMKVAENIYLPYDGNGGHTLGHEKINSSISIAVSSLDPDRVYVAYTEFVVPPNTFFPTPQLRVYVSSDAGVHWQRVLVGVLPEACASALPALAVAKAGPVEVLGLLYTQFCFGDLETLFLQATGEDLGNVKLRTLARFPDDDPEFKGQPYIGDYQDLEVIGSTFYGAFCASNDPDPGHFPSGVWYQRYVQFLTDNGPDTQSDFDLTGAGMAGTLVSSQGGTSTVEHSIDPFFFAQSVSFQPPFPFKVTLLDWYTLAWPKTDPPWTLESTSGFMPPIRWLAVTNGVVETDDEFRFRIDKTQRAGFFRLKQEAPTNAQYTVTAAAGRNGAITPRGRIVQQAGQNLTFTASADRGYAVDKWYLDGNVAQRGGSSFMLANIRAEHTLTVTFTPPDDLAVQKVGPIDPVPVGQRALYTITVANRGTQTATGVILTDELPAGSSFVSASSSQGSCTNVNGVIRCTLGSVAPGTGVTVEVRAALSIAGTFTNIVSVTGDASELNLRNNRSTELTVVQVPPGIVRQPQSLTVAAGENAAFSVLASGSTPLLYRWYFNGRSLFGMTNSTLTLTNVRTNQSGAYVVIVRNEVGKVESNPATLTIAR